MKAQEGKGNSWLGITAPTNSDMLQGCHASSFASHVLFSRDTHTL